MKKFVLYAIRWQLSSFVLAPCVKYIHLNYILTVMIANFIGAVVFFPIDNFIIFKIDKIILSIKKRWKREKGNL